MALLRMIVVAVGAGMLLGGCGKQTGVEEVLEPETILKTGFLEPRSIGKAVEGLPWVTDLTVADLDADGMLDVVLSEGRLNEVSWIRQVSRGEFEERLLMGGIAGPAHVEVVDFDQDGDRDVLVASMGIVTPNDQKIGAVVVLENDGYERFQKRVLVEGIDRVTDVQADDLDGDGDLDLSVGAFGYFEGEVRWMENLGGWEFANHSLLGLSGTVHAPIGDMDGDGDLDIVAVVSQDWEEIHLFENDGRGEFESRVVFGSPNKDYGSSGIQLVDMDGDGDLDVAYTNGDGFDYATPGARDWHGVQWLENNGKGGLAYRRIGDLSGAYSPCLVDLDGDGDRDFVAVGAFNDWTDSASVSLACFENLGEGRYERRVLAYQPTHMVVVDAGDFDGDGEPELVTGGFYFYPSFSDMARVALWDRSE